MYSRFYSSEYIISINIIKVKVGLNILTSDKALHQGLGLIS